MDCSTLASLIRKADGHVEFLKYLIKTRNYLAGISFVVLCLFVLSALCAPLLVSWDTATQVSLSTALEPPSLTFFFGTDELGRDLLARIIWGARITLLIALLGVAMSLGLGVLIGGLCGFYAGRLSELTMRLMDVVIAFPRILMAIILITVLGVGVTSLMLAIGISGIPIYARLFRAPVLTLKQREFVLASRSLGARDSTLLFSHILPNTSSLMIVQGTLSLAEAILIASGLSFLGLGPQPPIPEWGAMIATARAHITSHPHLVLVPGLALFFVILGFNLLGDALRDYTDPRMSTSR
jgi:ABC-type dipeptide/oligopeptide/nickel transport system permease subunit